MHSFPIPPLHAASKANNSFTLWLLDLVRTPVGSAAHRQPLKQHTAQPCSVLSLEINVI